MLNWSRAAVFLVVPLAVAIYLNFSPTIIRLTFAGGYLTCHHCLWQSWVIYEVNGTRYRMPLALSFVLIGFLYG